MFLGFLDLDDSSDRWFAGVLFVMCLAIVLIFVAAIYDAKNTTRLHQECESRGGVLLTHTRYKQSSTYTCVKKDVIVNL